MHKVQLPFHIHIHIVLPQFHQHRFRHQFHLQLHQFVHRQHQVYLRLSKWNHLVMNWNLSIMLNTLEFFDWPLGLFHPSHAKHTCCRTCHLFLQQSHSCRWLLKRVNRFHKTDFHAFQQEFLFWHQIRPLPSVLTLLTLDLIHITTDGSDNLFVQLNQTLRTRDPSKMMALRPYLYFLMSGLAALPDWKGTVFRGVPASSFSVVKENYSNGKDIHWSSFTSTTTSISRAKQFAHGKGGIIFFIHVLTGRDVSCYSAFKRENEILLGPNTRLVVTSDLVLNSDGMFDISLHQRVGQAFIFWTSIVKALLLFNFFGNHVLWIFHFSFKSNMFRAHVLCKNV